MSIAAEFLYPFRRREAHTDLSPAEATRALADEVEPRRWLRLNWSARTFQGSVADGAFDVQRIISYRNSFLPRIRGLIRADALGSSISFTMSLSPAAMISLTILLIIASHDSAAGSSPRAGLFVPVAILAFAWLLTSVSFYFEAAKTERALLRIFKATRRSAR